MAVLRRMANHQIRQTNKESEWSGICDNVFDQYSLVDDDVFGLGPCHRERSSSDESTNFVDYSISSGQSGHTTGTSPDPAWAEQVAAVAAMTAPPSAAFSTFDSTAMQPQAREAYGFWQKKLKGFEQQAVQAEETQRKLRTTQSHPDFLSLGGHPPPAFVSCPVPDSSFSVPRSRPREAANGKKRSTSQARSVSRGRPQGISKTNSSTAINHSSNNQCSTIRKASQSPSKMMNPSRYRAGFREVWTDRSTNSPMKLALRVPNQSLPESPPSSSQISQQNFAAFGSPTNPGYLTGYEPQLSPLTTTFQQAKLHTPDASPFFASPGQSYFEQNGTAATHNSSIAYPPRTTSLAANRIGSFDFGFGTATSDGTQVWPDSAYDHTTMTTNIPSQDVLAAVEQPVTLVDSCLAEGLGITCDSAVFYPAVTSSQVYSVPAQSYQQMQLHSPSRACYPPMPQSDAVPVTPRKQIGNGLRSRSPSPPMTEPRSRRASGGSRLRRTSKHRRAKSATAVPRNVQNLDKGGFVNFTPDDSNKILSGVAPSGSSKTKARREKEAADKRRRLSQAAIKAVVEAGGDLESLAQAGLYGLE